MKISPNDYLLLQIGGSKPLLVRCTEADTKPFKAVKEIKTDDGSDRAGGALKHETVEFHHRDVLSNLGRAPKVGSVYGVKIEPLVRQLGVPGWENVKIYQHFDDEQLKTLAHELKVAAKRLRELRVGGLRHLVEVRQPHGKYAGYHKFRPKSDVDILCVKPDENMEAFQYVVFHEYAHGMWHRMLSPRMRLRWIQLYHEYITLQEILQDELVEILDAIITAGSISSFMKDCDDNSLLIAKDALRHINRVHGLNRHHLELALENGESIAEYWPSSLELSEKETCITDYARKSPEEMFAESMAFHFCGRMIPKKIMALVEKTLSNLIRGGSTALVPKSKSKELADYSPKERRSKDPHKKKGRSKYKALT